MQPLRSWNKQSHWHSKGNPH